MNGTGNSQCWKLLKTSIYTLKAGPSSSGTRKEEIGIYILAVKDRAAGPPLSGIPLHYCWLASKHRNEPTRSLVTLLIVSIITCLVNGYVESLSTRTSFNFTLVSCYSCIRCAIKPQNSPQLYSDGIFGRIVEGSWVFEMFNLCKIPWIWSVLTSVCGNLKKEMRRNCLFNSFSTCKNNLCQFAIMFQLLGRFNHLRKVEPHCPKISLVDFLLIWCVI